MNLYSAEVKLVATAYIKANSEDEARSILIGNVGDGSTLDFGVDDIRDMIEDDQFQAPELSSFSFSPAVTFEGPAGDGINLAHEDVPEGCKRFSVRVRRVSYEDTVVTVDAVDESDAVDRAKLESACLQAEEWECYECDYTCDTSDVEVAK